MDVTAMIIEALKFFEAVKPGVEGAVAVGTALVSSSKASIYVIQKGAKLISYFITRKPKAKNTTLRTTKSDVAILVDINRRLLSDVGTYLDKHKIDADIIIITNDPTYSGNIKFLSPSDNDEWRELVQEFSTAMNGIKRTVGSAHLHIFLSTPLPLAFALGAVWGTVDEATIYHWENNTYWPVMPISRDLRIGK